mmetsp:Transcript_9824/g.29149  ORF Transcript_9824/g.29149 Transcript_9824/m.29149 type:complete len:202 (-) Transcript_9824:449-1054(-)
MHVSPGSNAAPRSLLRTVSLSPHSGDTWFTSWWKQSTPACTGGISRHITALVMNNIALENSSRPTDMLESTQKIKSKGFWPSRSSWTLIHGSVCKPMFTLAPLAIGLRCMSTFFGTGCFGSQGMQSTMGMPLRSWATQHQRPSSSSSQPLRTSNSSPSSSSIGFATRPKSAMLRLQRARLTHVPTSSTPLSTSAETSIRSP